MILACVVLVLRSLHVWWDLVAAALVLVAVIAKREGIERERERNCEHYISVSVPFFSCLPGLLKVFIFEWKKKRREKWQHQHILKKDNTQKEKNRRQGEKERIKDNTKKSSRTHSLFRVDTFAPLVISSNSIGAGQEIRTCPYWGVCSHVLSVCRSSFRTVGGVWIVLIRQYGCGRWRSGELVPNAGRGTRVYPVP